MEQHEVREVQSIAAPEPWTFHRPGESRPQPHPARARGLGVPGPDQGYALKLAAAFEDRVALAPGESRADVFAGAVAIALRRAALFGRAPIAADIELALILLGHLARKEGAWAPSGLVELSRQRLAGAAHDYSRLRALVDAIPEQSLRLKPDALCERLDLDPGCWRELAGA
jgi:hypothetical protein